MPLTNKAYLRVPTDITSGVIRRIGIFELTGVEETRTLDRRMLIGPRGQALQGTLELASVLPFADGLGDIGEAGQGVTIDGGQSEHTFELEAEIIPEGLSNWGDPSGDPKFDASASSDSLFKREDVIHYFCRRGQTDSLTPGQLYWSEWTDGTYAASAGAHNQPADVLVRQLETSIARDDSALTVTLVLERTETFPDWDSSAVKDALDDLK